MIFVFGSNLAGIHGAGAAAYAAVHKGASYGIGEGMQGESYALPTCAEPGLPLLLVEISAHVGTFLTFARDNPNLQFQVTRVGCGLAGYEDSDIAPMFRGAPDNVWLPAKFAEALYWLGYGDGDKRRAAAEKLLRSERGD